MATLPLSSLEVLIDVIDYYYIAVEETVFNKNRSTKTSLNIHALSFHRENLVMKVISPVLNELFNQL